MKIVLRQDVPKLGESGTVQSVADGYARNFLIPQGMAVVATAGEMKVSAHNQAVKERKIVKQEQVMQSLADRIDGQRLEFTARAGRTGRLYGSVTAGDIAERLAETVGEEIDRRKLVLEDAVRSIGEHTVDCPSRRSTSSPGDGDRPRRARRRRGSQAASRKRGPRRGQRPSGQPRLTLRVRQTARRGPSKPSRMTTRAAEGHPEPGSGHDDSETVTAEDGPELDPIDRHPRCPTARSRPGVDPITETNEAGEGVEVREEMDA